MNQVKSIFLLAGGSFRNPGSMVPFMARALQECGSQRPRVAYLGAANGDSINFFRSIRLLLQRAGAGEVFSVPLAGDGADVTAARRALGSADAVFISGGEVEDGMRWLSRHDLVGFMRELRCEGKVFIGLSAGSIMMGSHWVRWKKPDDDSTAELFDCLGFVPTIFDTHAENEDWRELRAALRLRGSGERGYGIPTGGMVTVDSRGRMLASGSKPLLSFANRAGQVVKL